MSDAPGLVVCFGSGETSASGRRIWEWLFRRLSPPIRVAVLETPAGFELNSAQVAGRVGEFLRRRLQNYHPEITVIPARKRGTPFSPDNPQVVAPLLHSNVVFMGPGSPTYAVRQLRGSLAWHLLVARHRRGAAIVLASAAVIAASAHALPVYEIYKVGEDLHWKQGLDFFGVYGLSLVFIPHWNNTEGGAELDTSRCFMGRSRFEALLALLPAEATVIGIDEHTALVIDVGAQRCQVLGKGRVTRIRDGEEKYFVSHAGFPLAELGPVRMPRPEEGIPPEVWERVLEAEVQPSPEPSSEPPPEVQALVQQRQAARERRDWATADALREQIAALGWRVIDTPEGPRLEPVA